MSANCTLTLDQKKIRTYSYKEYMELTETYSKLGETSGNEKTEDKISVTKLNFVRMTRMNKTVKVDEQLIEVIRNFPGKQCWTVITEAWCGDGAQNIPALAKIAEASDGKINFQLVFRDDNPSFMNQYLTNGGQAIPKLIARNESGADLFCWGPRPAGASAIMQNWKANPQGVAKSEVMTTMHKWYIQNNHQDLMNEIRMLILSCESGKC